MRVFERLLAGSDEIPPHVAVGAPDPQQLIAVSMHGLTDEMDVTRNAVIVSLRPLLFAVCFARADTSATAMRHSRPWFEFRQIGDDDTLLGRIDLKATGVIRHQEFSFYLFRATGFQNYCISILRQRRYYLSEWWKFQRKADSYNFYMELRDLFSHMVFYTIPRPVVLITTMHEDRSNIFPMDLIGPTASPLFLLALRTTSPSIPLMRDSRKIAMSNIPFEFTDVAYRLGVHHKKSNINWSSLPFDTVRSNAYGFHVPNEALKVRELIVDRVLET